MKIKVKYRIRKIRTEQKMSIRELSRISGISHSQISDIENNNKDTTVTTLCLLAIALNVDPVDLFELEIINL